MRQKISIEQHHLATLTMAKIIAFILFVFVIGIGNAKTTLTTGSEQPISVAFLGVHFINDNQAFEPTSDAERTRLVRIEVQFKSKLTDSGHYTFVTIPPAIKAKISADQPAGECGGCEFEYGQALQTKLVTWIVVQKVSNLILNINVYMADVASQRLIFVRSVDIRSNTDESWTHGLTYLIKYYLLKEIPK